MQGRGHGGCYGTKVIRGSGARTGSISPLRAASVRSLQKEDTSGLAALDMACTAPQCGNLR